jgi:hypothetical protein
MRSERGSQRDLFKMPPPRPELRSDVRTRLGPLLRALLTETAGQALRTTVKDSSKTSEERTAMTKIAPEHLKALKQKARRGELFMTVATGYLRAGHDRIEKDPDRRVQEAITLVFAKFAEVQTVRQLHLWMRHEATNLPAVGYGSEGRSITWKLPVCNTVHHIPTPERPSQPLTSEERALCQLLASLSHKPRLPALLCVPVSAVVK